jgi:hypothetical protein
MDSGSAAALWMAVVALGGYHGLNPAMGWPLAVANGLVERRAAAVFTTVLPLGAGHLLAMALVLVPFSVLTMVVRWQQPIRIAGALLVLGFGLYRLVQRRHPRWLARIRPTQLVLWSFVIATAHGAGIMLLPFALGLCDTSPGVSRLIVSGLGTALAVSLVHTAAMMAVGTACAWTVYRYLGLRPLERGWLNLDTVWAASLVLAGGASLLLAVPKPIAG